jgi:hypothetical protein
MTNESILEADGISRFEHRNFVQKTFPYRIDLSTGNPYLVVGRWCEEQFGKQWSSLNTDGVWTELPRHVGCREWYFKNEKDAVLFSLRYS